MHDNDKPSADAGPPSKSQLKREARERFDLGRRLSELPPATLAELPLEEELRTAVEFARSIKSRGARKRQLGYVARLLRESDVAPLLDALERQQGGARETNARHHRAEAWRDALLYDGDVALAVLVRARRDFEPQALRILLRNAQREAERGKPPASARKLYRLLSELDRTEPLPEPRGGF